MAQRFDPDRLTFAGDPIALAQGIDYWNPRDLDIFYLDLEGEREVVPLVVAPRDQGGARISDDGRWLAYESRESGRSEVYVVDFPAAGRKVQVTSGGGGSPFWSAEGRQLHCRVRYGQSNAAVSPVVVGRLPRGLL